MNNKDRRVRKTKKTLQDGLAELMMEKDLRNITVRELADHCDVHRATFYAHYQDVYDLYEQIEAAAMDELAALLETAHGNDDVYRMIVDYVHGNAKLARLLLDKQRSMAFFDRVSAFLEEQYIEILALELGIKEIPQEMRYFVTYHMQGCMAIISRWAKEGFVLSKEQIIQGIELLENNVENLEYS
ncbi:MAG: TetR/AcrR family transcriptional regulator [Oscillospiraceae bacterium]|nr:TetR/AcrR family transcriptional regulator [Oscillospiraceae bacterium]